MRWILEGSFFAGKGIKSQVAIKTRFRNYPFVIDFLLGYKHIIEVHGDHKAHWHTRKRENADHTKTECLLAEGYPVFAVKGTGPQIKKYQETIKDALVEHIHLNKKYTLIDLDQYGSAGFVTHEQE